ncbi:hypothetical protein HYPSUDRAFT_642368 [Hypholoma sublateritium FD-334 SS-4]|uniref:Uncharacterized protein n=1 Tax=Hypholoma sublateritium (strain FD-334 SS-4) TaxID=945553 RepID=A0A0D2P1M8_HYPSF|nr:hypothetical protein HYPSUDRAFT_642368 [Hypholoma sublateritium FD-334 SS-4]
MPLSTNAAGLISGGTISHRTHQIIGGAAAGVVIILYIAVALALRRRRTRLVARELHPTIQPFNLHPFTLIRRGLLHASDRLLKGRLAPESAAVPSKFRNVENDTNSQAIVPQLRSSSPVRNASSDPCPPLPMISHLREQDSGLRIVAETAEADEANMVIVLPPEYTAV